MLGVVGGALAPGRIDAGIVLPKPPLLLVFDAKPPLPLLVAVENWPLAPNRGLDGSGRRGDCILGTYRSSGFEPASFTAGSVN